LIAAVFPAAAQGKPDKDALPSFELTVPAEPAGCGSFDVLIATDANKEVQKSFYDKDGNLVLQHISGQFRVTATNLASQKSVALNVPGPYQYIYGADGSVQISTQGPNLIWFSDAGAGPDGLDIAVFYGRTEAVFDKNGYRFLSYTGNVMDVCALLAG
jgi:hypothetical protein